MSNVLFVYEHDAPTISIMRDSFSQGVKQYGIVPTFLPVLDVTRDDINRADVVMFIRPTDFLSSALAKKAKKSGCFVITYCDDDLLYRPTNRPLVSWRRTNVKKTLKTSNIVLSPSKRICCKYSLFTLDKRGVVANSSVRVDEIVEKEREAQGKIRIIYASNASHAMLFEKYILPSLPRLYQTLGNIFSLTFIGVHPNLNMMDSSIAIETTFVDSMSFYKYRNYMATHNMDIGLAPLDDDEFSKCKYFNKYIEYSLFGIAGIYSNIEPYTNVVVNMGNGILVDNDNDSWYEALRMMIENEELRNKCAQNALRQIRNDFSEEVVKRKLITDIPEMLTYKSTRSACKTLVFTRMTYRLSIILESVYLVVGYLHESGIKGLIDKINSHLKERREFNNL